MRCVNCGLLAMRKKSDASLAEVPGYIREKDPTTRTAVANKFEDEHEITPVCLARQATFSPKKEEYSEQFKEERECPGFTEWRQGFTPKEHQEAKMHDTHTKAERWGTLKSTILSMIVGGCLTAIFQSRHMRPFMDSEAMPIMAFAIAAICLVVILKE